MQSPFGQESGVGVMVGIKVGEGLGVNVGGIGVNVGGIGVNVGGIGVEVGGSPKMARLTAMQARVVNPSMTNKKSGAKRLIAML